MNYSLNKVAIVSVACALLFVGAGCGKGATAPTTEESTRSPLSGVVDTFVATAPCDHPYYPLTPGYTITYATKSGGADMTYTMVVESVTDAVAKVGFKFTKPVATTVYQELGCNAGTLVAKTYLDMASVLGGIDMKAETKNSSGEIMPANLAVGKTWTNRFETTLTPGPKFPAKIGAMQVVVDSVSRVVGEESVTVPAGTFTAMKVEEKSTSTVNVPGMPTMTPQVMTSYQWWVKGVGLVKQASGSATSGEGVTEAVSIKKP